MIATTIAAIGRNQVTSTRACCGSASAQPVERTNSELIAPSNRLDGGVSGDRGGKYLGVVSTPRMIGDHPWVRTGVRKKALWGTDCWF